MTAEFDQVAWKAMASGLVTVRNMVRKQKNGCTRAEERAALAKVAGSPAFAELGPTALSPYDRGRWIVARVRRRLIDLAEGETAPGPGDSPARRAIRCWARYVDEGLSPTELHDAYPELIPNEVPAKTAVARRGRVQSLMWAGGARGDKDSLDGVLLVAAELRTALSIDLPGGSRMDATTFAYEWERLRTVLPAGRYLLQVFAQLAPDHRFPQALLREAGDCLPGPVEAICAEPAQLRSTCSALRDRGLLVLDGDAVLVEDGVRQHVIDQVIPVQRAHWTAIVLRFLTYALRADTHHSASWEQWRLAYPHVLVVCEAAERDQVQLGDVVYLLDRASVYVRDGVEDAGLATALAERAVRLSVELGANDPELHGECLGNLALAHLVADRKEKAVEASAQSLEHLAAALGENSVTYAESLNVHGNILGSWGRLDAAEEAHTRALDIMRNVYAETPRDDVRAVLVEALNDYAAQLLSTSENGHREQDDRVETGRALLEEASRLLRRGDYGWTQIELNLANACRTAGDLHAARQHLEAVRDHCVKEIPGPSTTLVAALVSLSEVYDVLEDPRAAQTLREAHRVDNALAASLDRPGREGRTR